ncbi:MAG: hypothetical protein ACR2OE_08795 [Thermomicrobiales bacterium]
MTEPTGDIFIHGVINPDTLRAATARAFGLLPNRVGVRAPETPWPDAEVVAEVWTPDLRGDWPGQYIYWIPDADMNRLPAILASLARDLGVPVMTSGDDDDVTMNLYLPDGSAHDVVVFQNEADSSFRDTPEMQRLIVAATPLPIAS